MSTEGPSIPREPGYGPLRDAVRMALRKEVLARTIPIALVVGTVFTALNQAAPILGDRATVSTWLRVVANYVVPLCVSTFGYVSAMRRTTSSPTRRT